MKDKQTIIHFDFGFVEVLGAFILMGLVTGAIFLYQGIEARNLTAYLILGGVVTTMLLGLGGGFVLFVLWVAYRWEAGRESREAERFKANAIENLSQMAAMQRVQNQQNAMLLRQAREAQRALPSPDEVVDVDALIAEDSVFDELEV